jgi:hypothetical protein
MSFSDILLPRKDILAGHIEGIIDLENIRDPSGKRLEARPNEFLELTWPTKDIVHVIQKLHGRFSEKQQSEGLFLFEGYKGSGKSHLQLLIYHLAKNREVALGWLGKHGLKCDLPENIEVVVHKFTDFPLYALWSLIVKNASSDVPPNLDELRAAIEGKHLLLILDELEMGIRMIADSARRDQNLAFLQMLTEEANRSENANITLFASIYDAAREPGATLKRVPRVDVKFSDPIDRTKIVLHRLFENAHSVDCKQVEAVIKSFRNDWKRKGLSVTDQYCDQMLQSFPFSPTLIELIQEHARNLFQGTRGALSLLGALVRTCHRKQDLVTIAHTSLRERSIKNLLIDLDPGSTIIQCAQSDLESLRDLPLCEEIVAGVLLATLVSSGRAKGMAEKELALEVVKPGVDVNVFKSTLQALHKLGTYFHEQEGAYFFDPQEKPNAKVEYHSLRVKASDALAEAFKCWKTELFREGNAVIFQDAEQAQAELAILDSKRPRYVLAPRRLTKEERHALYFGLSNRNLVILLEPKSKDFSALENPDIIKWAQRHIAAAELGNSAGSAERRRQFERIAKEDKDYILRAFKNAGLSFASVQKYAASAADDQVELEPLGNVTTREEVAAKLRQQFFPVQLFEEHVTAHLVDYFGQRIRDVERIYRETLGYPIAVHETTIRDALWSLCLQKQIGIKHEKDSACGRKPQLADAELADALVTEPFPDSKLRPSSELPKLAGQQQFGGNVISSLGEPNVVVGIEVESEKPTIDLETPFCHGIGDLRQRVAMLLVEHEEAIVKLVTFRIFFEKRSCDLATLPSGLRGSIAGLGDIAADLTIGKHGEFSKVEVEQLVEKLPSLPGGDYKAELRVQLQEPVTAHANADE